MSSIAEDLGGSKATLWSYFPSKAALFRTVVDRESEDFRRELIEHLDPGDGLESGLLGVCRALIERMISPRGLALRRAVAAETVRFPDVGRSFFEAVPQELHHVLATYLAGFIEAGELRQSDPLEAAEVLTTLCHGRCFRRAVFGVCDSMLQEEVEADACLAVEVFLRSYRGHAS
jgi:AcrR family transcriptional regulator